MVTAEARTQLVKMQSAPALHKAATRALLNDARMRSDRPQALALATELAHSPNRSLKDSFDFLEELQLSDLAQFKATLSEMQAKAASSPDAVYVLMTWMNGHGLAAETVAWSRKLPSRIVPRMPVALGVAEAFAISEHWRELRGLIQNANWESYEFLRFALQARVVEKDHAQGRGAEFNLKWNRAISAANGEAGSLSMLARLTGGWGWKKESSQVWWFLAQRKTGQRPALRALYRIYAEEKNTPELYRVACRIAEVEPANPIAQNNKALLGLLLGKELPQAHRTAEENFRNYPGEAAFASTRALSLHLQQRSQEAREILEKLPEATLRQPSEAACYAGVLAALGDREKAAVFVQIAMANRQQLFPEEAALAGKAIP